MPIFQKLTFIAQKKKRNVPSVHELSYNWFVTLSPSLSLALSLFRSLVRSISLSPSLVSKRAQVTQNQRQNIFLFYSYSHAIMCVIIYKSLFNFIENLEDIKKDTGYFIFYFHHYSGISTRCVAM